MQYIIMPPEDQAEAIGIRQHRNTHREFGGEVWKCGFGDIWADSG